jgi:hypothetical protein
MTGSRRKLGEVVPARYITTSTFSERLAYVERIVGEPQDRFCKHRFEFIDKSGKTILRLNDIPVSSFNNGLAVIRTYRPYKFLPGILGVQYDHYVDF